MAHIVKDLTSTQLQAPAEDANQLRNNQTVTRKSGDICAEAARKMTQISTEVNDAIVMLTGQGMRSLAGVEYGRAVQVWIDDFNVIQSKLVEMANYLYETASGMAKGDQDNLALASSIIGKLNPSQ